jgi:hypothetical protein
MTIPWNGDTPTPVADLQKLIGRIPRLTKASVTTADWVITAYGAENIERDKHGLPLYRWQEFIDAMTVDAKRKKMFIANRMFAAALRRLNSPAASD